MANNSDIAYKIYKTIKDKQDEQIRLGTIKESDIIELYEGNFIENLHSTIQFQMSALSDLKPEILSSVISSTYVNILASIENITDVRELSFSDGIRIPNEIIKISINNAIAKNEDRIHNNVIANPIEQIATMAMIAKFSEFKTIEEKIDYFKSLSKEEQEEFLDGYTRFVMGDRIAEERKEYAKMIELFENSEIKKWVPEEAQAAILEKFKKNSTFIRALEEFGFPPSNFKDSESQLRVFEFIHESKKIVKSGDIKEGEFAEKIKRLASDRNIILSEEQLESIIRQIFENRENIDEYLENLGVEKKDKIKGRLEGKKTQEFIKNLARKAIPEISEKELSELIDYYGDIIFDDEKVDFHAIVIGLMQQTEGKYSINYNEYYKNVEIIKEKIDLLRSTIPGKKIDDVQLLTLYGNAIDENGNVDLTRLDELTTDEVTDFVVDVPAEDFMADMGDFLGVTFGEDMLVVGMEDFMREEESQPLPEEVAAELQAIPVALQRINCQPEDIAKGMEAYRQMIGLLTPEEINSEPEALTEILKKAVGEINLDGVAGDILKMMSQITFNGQLSEILKNSKDVFLASLSGPLLDPRVYAGNPEQNNSNSSNSSSLTERVDEDTLKAGFEALAVDLQIADPTIIRPEELVTDENAQLENGQEENTEFPKKEARKEKAEGAVISKLQAFFGVYRNAGMIEVQEVSEEIKEIVQELDLNLQNNNVHRVEEEIKNDEGIEQG